MQTTELQTCMTLSYMQNRYLKILATTENRNF